MLNQLLRNALMPIVKVLYRPRVEGAENVPSEGAVILASNHLSAVDTAVIPLVAGRPVAFLGKLEYFTGRGIKGTIAKAFLTALGYVPVDRHNAHAALAALAAATKVLEAGGAFGIYPEGTRSLDGKLHRGHTGVAQLALVTGAPVVPVALIGTERVQPVGKRIPRIAKVTVRFGEPLDFGRYAGMESAPAVRRAVTDQIMYAILELSGQTYVDSYHRRPDAA